LEPPFNKKVKLKPNEVFLSLRSNFILSVQMPNQKIENCSKETSRHPNFFNDEKLFVLIIVRDCRWFSHKHFNDTRESVQATASVSATFSSNWTSAV